jgi:hypothetical protein
VRFVVGGEVVLHMAEVAANAQRRPERLHGLHQVLGLQEFQILSVFTRVPPEIAFFIGNSTLGTETIAPPCST